MIKVQAVYTQGKLSSYSKGVCRWNDTSPLDSMWVIHGTPIVQSSANQEAPHLPDWYLVHNESQWHDIPDIPADIPDITDMSMFLLMELSPRREAEHRNAMDNPSQVHNRYKTLNAWMN